MQYHNDSQQDMFAHLRLEEKVRDVPLNPLTKLIQWINFEFFRPLLEMALGYSRLKSVLKKNGRPPYDVVMIRWNTRSSFRQFLALSSSSDVPDEDSVDFRDKLQSKGVIKKLFEQVNNGLNVLLRALFLLPNRELLN